MRLGELVVTTIGFAMAVAIVSALLAVANNYMDRIN